MKCVINIGYFKKDQEPIFIRCRWKNIIKSTICFFSFILDHNKVGGSKGTFSGWAWSALSAMTINTLGFYLIVLYINMGHVLKGWIQVQSRTWPSGSVFPSSPTELPLPPHAHLCSCSSKTVTTIYWSSLIIRINILEGGTNLFLTYFTLKSCQMS